MAGEDAAFVERARAGDREAFRFLVERHGRNVYRLAYRITGNQGDAEDVAQEAFLKAYRSLDRFESRSNFSTWIYRIASNCAYDQLRARARRPEDPIEGEQGPLPIESEGASPERLAAGADLRRQLTAAMRRLTPAERTAFVLRHHEGRSIAEIGAALGLDTSAAKHSVFRAVRKLRAALQPLAQEALG
ncbi:MAG TPA: sigma-70 family RNA polymerase sigma factor [Vicinamibacteria bacterium]|nr:sigma-70 family RNA polymerase sigma factor [Vicinamibacteria bacterium]